MSRELRKRQASILNMVFMMIYQLVTAVFGFILPSLIMHYYGAELHGYTTTVTSIMSYIALINAGLAPAAIQALYAPLAKKDTQRINEVLNAVSRFYNISGCLYVLVVVLVAIILPFLISNELPSYLVISVMIVIGASNTLECFIYSKYKVLLQADQKLYIVAVADTIIYFLRVILQIVLILNEQSIIFVMAVPAVMVILRMMILSYYCRINYSGFDRKILPDNSALTKRWSAMLHQISALVVNNTDVILLTLFGNLVQVSIYSVYNLVFSHIYIFFNSVFSSGTVASFGRIIQEKRQNILSKAYGLYEYGYYMIMSFVYGVAASMILPFVSIYTAGMENIKYFDVTLALLFIIIGVVNNLRMPGVTLIQAAGHYKETQWQAILEALINIVVSICLIKPFGMYGLLIGTICSFLYRTTDIVLYVHRYILNESCKYTIFRGLRVILVIIISVILYKQIVDVYTVISWGMWIKYAVINCVLTGIIVIVLNAIFEPKIFVECAKLVLHKGKE